MKGKKKAKPTSHSQ